jgi:hypothetical protein
MSGRIYDAKQMMKIAELLQGLSDLQEKFEPNVVGTAEDPLYIFSAEIVIRHYDGYTVGRIGMDDFLYFELTDETYGEKDNQHEN